VPLRQWVLSLPFELYVPLAYERNLVPLPQGQRPLAHTPVWQNMPSQHGCPDSPQGEQTSEADLLLHASPGPHQLPQHGKSLLPHASQSMSLVA
jgi:hypothetical protein